MNKYKQAINHLRIAQREAAKAGRILEGTGYEGEAESLAAQCTETINAIKDALEAAGEG